MGIEKPNRYSRLSQEQLKECWRDFINQPVIVKEFNKMFVDKDYHEKLVVLYESEENTLKAEIKELKKEIKTLKGNRVEFNYDKIEYDSLFKVYSATTFVVYNFIVCEFRIIDISLVEFFFKINNLDTNTININTSNSNITQSDIGLFFYHFKKQLQKECYMSIEKVEMYLDHKFLLDGRQDFNKRMKRYIKPYKNADIKPKFYTKINELFYGKVIN